MNTFRFLGAFIRPAIGLLLVFVMFLFLPTAFALGQAEKNTSYIFYYPFVSSSIQCLPNQAISDPANDVDLAHIDVIGLSTSLSGQTLTADLKLRNLPAELTFDRAGLGVGFLEYEWSVMVDLDNNLETGDPLYPYRGADILLSATHIVTEPNMHVTQPVANGVQANIWLFDPALSEWVQSSTAALVVDVPNSTLTLAAAIPGITAVSPVSFSTFDFNPEGTSQSDHSYCSPPLPQ